MVVDPATPLSEAVHLLETPSAVMGPGPTPRGSPIEAELATEPVGPVVPWVLTVVGPEGGASALGSLAGYWPLKSLAGPYCATAPSLSVAVMGVDEPPAGRVTDGDALSAGAST